MGDGRAEGDSRQDEAWGCQSPPPWKPILICIPLPVSFLPLGLSPYFLQRILILSLICICHLTSYSASHSFCSGHSIALIVALALRRPEWTFPCSSNLATSLHLCCIVYWPCHPFLGSHFHHTALPLLHGLSSLLPHGCCRWWL